MTKQEILNKIQNVYSILESTSVKGNENVQNFAKCFNELRELYTILYNSLQENNSKEETIIDNSKEKSE